MSIPLERLYHYINDTANNIRGKPFHIYRFDPNGSKKIEDLKILVELTEEEFFTSPEIYCNDQEPLNYDLYTTGPMIHSPLLSVCEVLERKNITFPRLNFRGQVVTIWNQAVLLHSEKRSVEVERYRATQFLPVYYWCHAVIALDWFRYAQHVARHKQVRKTFLIYNRAWSGPREYRLRFLDLVLQLGLDTQCQTSVNPIEPELGIHYNTHQFKNATWKPTQVLENFFPLSTAQSHYSADFDIEDYKATDIEVVLETLFDDNRLHLTEKSLRPIACAQPFILAGTHGSLEYLRSYGFKTFGDVWDEGYDLVKDSEERLITIADLMKQIANWAPDVKEKKLLEAHAIADYNKKHFFSEDFFNLVIHELKTNLTSALTHLEETNTASNYFHRRQIFTSDAELVELTKHTKKPELRALMLTLAQHYAHLK
jgi:hypothetical protein